MLLNDEPRIYWLIYFMHVYKKRQLFYVNLSISIYSFWFKWYSFWRYSFQTINGCYLNLGVVGRHDYYLRNPEEKSALFIWVFYFPPVSVFKFTHPSATPQTNAPTAQGKPLYFASFLGTSTGRVLFPTIRSHMASHSLIPSTRSFSPYRSPCRSLQRSLYHKK